jgi:hypothetical protein
MVVNLGKELAAIEQMTVGQLRDRYAEVFGEVTRAGNKVWLQKKIAWRIQAVAEGDLSQRARERAAELANDADVRVSAPRLRIAATTDVVQVGPNQGADVPNPTRLPPAGSVLTRNYKGKNIQVRVLADSFEHEGQTFKSLSAVAKAITGQHCNGFHFFRLTKEG